MSIGQSRLGAGRSAQAGGVLARALMRAARSLGLSQKDVARVLGVSEATVTRLASGRAVDPASKEGELAILLLRLYRSLDSLLGGNEANVRAWMHSQNHHLAGTPAELIGTVIGLLRVTEYLDAMRGKI